MRERENLISLLISELFGRISTPAASGAASGAARLRRKTPSTPVCVIITSVCTCFTCFQISCCVRWPTSWSWRLFCTLEQLPNCRRQLGGWFTLKNVNYTLNICIHNHLFVLFLVSLRIQYTSLVRCSCYTHDPSHMSVLLLYLHVSYSKFPAYVSTLVYAPPSSSILVHIYRQFSYVLFVLCSILIPMFLFPFFFLRNSIDTWVTLSIDVIIPLHISYPSDSFCISFL